MDCGSVAGNTSRNSCDIYNTPQNIFYPQNPSDLTAEWVMYLFTSHVRQEWSVHLWEHVINHGVLRPRAASKALCMRAHVRAVLMCAHGAAANHAPSCLRFSTSWLSDSVTCSKVISQLPVYKREQVCVWLIPPAQEAPVWKRGPIGLGNDGSEGDQISVTVQGNNNTLEYCGLVFSSSFCVVFKPLTAR